jgi:signal transduction histidine kinase/ActR/RegA family two-component response regulator
MAVCDVPRRHQPSLRLAIAITVAAALLMLWLRMAIYPHRTVPLTYGLPILLALWHRDRRLLWTLVCFFLGLATFKLAMVVPDEYFDHPAQQLVFLLMQWGNILVPAVAVHAVLAYGDRLHAALARLAAANAELAASNEELAAREEEISRQNEELTAQSEELEQQTEELRQQSEELQSANEELAERENALDGLLHLTHTELDEEDFLCQMCQHVPKLLGDMTLAAAILEAHQDQLLVRAACGFTAPAGGQIPLLGTLAKLVMERNQAAQLTDVRLRPDIHLPTPQQGPGFGATISAPLCVEGKPVGVLEAYAAAPHEWTAPQGQLLSWLANQCARVWHSFRLREQLRRQQTQLERAKQVAESANEAKSRFLANVSHELRTPMNSVLGMTELALEEPLPESARDCLQTARESAQSLLALLNEILDFSRIEAGRFHLEPSAFSLRAALDETLRAMRVRAEGKGLDLHWELAPNVPDEVVGDRLRLRQVLVNMVDNAIKFTADGHVRVRVLPVGELDGQVELQFAVSDTGIGIAPDVQKRIFEPFTQADISTTRQFGGTGLGLTIAANLVQLMGGRIWVESEPGQGTTFYFTSRFPRSPEPAPAASGGGSSPAAPDTPLRTLKVLLAEDTPANCKLVERILARRGHTVRVAANGAEAIDLVRAEAFDLILMDVQMPVVDGLQATAEIRRLGSHAGTTPIVAMTAHAMKEDRQRCLDAGMDGYLSKPITAAELVQVVERLGTQPRA